MEAKREKKHAVNMNVRKLLELSGVVSVERFDRDRFDLHTDCGALHIKGQNLHIKTLNLEQGLLIIEGYVHGLQYAEARTVKRTTGWFGKLLK